jgi:hypothetical protein
VSELDVLDPVPGTITFSNGLQANVLDLKTRQFFRMLKILTRNPNLSSVLSQGGSALFDGTSDAAVFATRLVTMLLFSIPEAENETVEFLASMLEPVGLVVRPNLDKTDKARNDEKWVELRTALFNPELEDLIDIISSIVERESEDLLALGKKIGAMFKLARKTGQLNPETPTTTGPTSPAQNSSEVSPEPTTPSQLPTDGPTNE